MKPPALHQQERSMSASQPNVIPIRPTPQPRPQSRWPFAGQKLMHQGLLAYKWWLRAQRPYQPLFVIATTRTGSNLLMSYLRQLQGVRTQGEILFDGNVEGPLWKRMSQSKAIGHLRRSLHMLKSPIRGCKLMLYQLAQYDLTLNQLDAAFPQARYIVLYRQSLADQFVSKKLAKATNQYMLRPGEEQRQTRITIDPQELRRYCDDTRNSYRNVLAHKWLPQRGAILSYEELTADAGGCLRQRICPLIGVPAIEPKTSIRKQNTLPLSQRVANYQQVASLLASPVCRQHHDWPSAASTLRRIAA
jgi:LPS sulfotransferase NodH